MLSAGFALLAIVGCSQRASGPAAVSAKSCGLCHDLPPTDPAHIYHVEVQHYRCSYCHGAGYEVDSTRNVFTVNGAIHMNGDTDVIFTAPWSDSGKAAYNKSLKQCSNVYCHGGIPQGTHATVQWNATSIDKSCGACHDLSENTSDSNSIYTFHFGHALSAYPATGTATVGGNVNQCNYCHDSLYSAQNNTVDPTTHINGVFNPGTCGACHAPDWSTWQEYKTTHPSAKRHAASAAPMPMRLKYETMSGARSPLSMMPR